MPEKHNIELGERIRELRNALELDQQEFGRRIGISSKNTIINYEYGRTDPGDDKLTLIETVFNVNPEWLRHGR